MKRSLPWRLLISGLIGALALSVAGCWNPFAPSGGGDNPPVIVSYKLRTSSENVLYNLKTAYVYENVDEYIACLAEEFEFHLNPKDIAEDPKLPVSWGRQAEEDIHTDMFSDASDVERITLTLTNVYRDTIPGPEPGDPVTWKHEEAVDLRVSVTTDDITYLATADQEFIFRIDPLEVGPEGETLWEIIDWWDLEDPDTPFRDSPDVEHMTFGGVKALYR